MKKSIFILLAITFVACKKSETPKSVCDIGGIEGTFYKKRVEGMLDQKGFSEVVLRKYGNDSFSMSFPKLPLWSDTSMFYSNARPCSVLMFKHKHVSMKDFVVYAYMRGDTLVDSFVQYGKWQSSIFFTLNKN